MIGQDHVHKWEIQLKIYAPDEVVISYKYILIQWNTSFTIAVLEME